MDDKNNTAQIWSQNSVSSPQERPRNGVEDSLNFVTKNNNSEYLQSPFFEFHPPFESRAISTEGDFNLLRAEAPVFSQVENSLTASTGNCDTDCKVLNSSLFEEPSYFEKLLQVQDRPAFSPSVYPSDAVADTLSIEQEHLAQEARFYLRESENLERMQPSLLADTNYNHRKVPVSYGTCPSPSSIEALSGLLSRQARLSPLAAGVSFSSHQMSGLGLNINDQSASYSSLFSELNSGGGSTQADAGDGYIYKIQFKRLHRYFTLGPNAQKCIKVGDFVKVEADRGEDLGVVCKKIARSDFREERPTAGFRGRGYSVMQEDGKRLLRIATDDETAQLPAKLCEEMKTLMVSREKVMMRKFHMNIVDAEYQFDRHKLTFYFESDRRVDFRELVSDLFALYKTRIWMQQIDTSFVPDEAAARALLTGVYTKTEGSPVSPSLKAFDERVARSLVSDSIPWGFSNVGFSSSLLGNAPHHIRQASLQSSPRRGLGDPFDLGMLKRTTLPYDTAEDYKECGSPLLLSFAAKHGSAEKGVVQEDAMEDSKYEFFPSYNRQH